MEDLSDWLATVLVVLVIGCFAGYVARYIQEPIHYEQAEVDAMVGELTVIARGEICGEGP